MNPRRKISNILNGELVNTIANSPVAETPFIKEIYNIVYKNILPNKACWIRYEGYYLYIDPNQHLGKALYKKGKMAHEPYVINVLKHYTPKGGTVVDVGSYFGSHMLSFRKQVGKEGKVIAIEANPQNIKFIKKTIQKNNFDNIDPIWAAAYDAEGTVTLCAHKHSEKSGVHKRKDLKYSEEYKVNTIELCKAVDSYKKIDFIKIDIEGAEFRAIKGLAECIEKAETMMIEVHKSCLKKRELDKLISKLNSYGGVSIIPPDWTGPSDSIPIKSGDDILKKEYILFENYNNI